MQLREIDKDRYRRNLWIVFAAITAALMILSIAFSTLLIQIFSSPEVSHFIHNLSGVAAAAITVAFALHRFRYHPFMVEVVYVWDLKQQLNRISRKLVKIEAAVENNNRDAMMIMNFMYRGSRQLYKLDDNTITMEGLLAKIRVLDERMEAAGLSLSTDSYEPVMLNQF